MKKLFLAVIMSIALCGIALGPVGAQEAREIPKDVIEELSKDLKELQEGIAEIIIGPQVGDGMPSLEGYVVVQAGVWYNPDLTPGGNKNHMAASEEEEAKYLAVYNECDGIPAGLPFAIFDIETRILYLDNVLPQDGKIDAVERDPQGYVYEDAPGCEKAEGSRRGDEMWRVANAAADDPSVTLGEFTWEGELDPSEFDKWEVIYTQPVPQGGLWVFVRNPDEASPIDIVAMAVSMDGTLIGYRYFKGGEPYDFVLDSDLDRYVRRHLTDEQKNSCMGCHADKKVVVPLREI